MHTSKKPAKKLKNLVQKRLLLQYDIFPVRICLVKVNRRNTRMPEMPEMQKHQKYENDVEDVIMVYLLITFN